MEQEIACPGSNGNVILRAESIPFSQIPGQSRLFTEYQEDPLSLKKYYPSAVASHTDLSDRIPEVLASYRIDRNVLCETLAEINRTAVAGEKVFDNIDLLRDNDCVAVLTGQQAGLFSGPLYTIYKALSAIRAAECLRGRGFKAVPVFWIATEDHDFDEVNQADLVNKDSRLSQITSNAEHKANLPVGSVSLDDSISATIASVFDALKSTEFTAGVRSLIAGSYSAGTSFGGAFAKLLALFTAEYGLILVDPMHPKLKRLAAPVYVEAAKRSDEIAAALVGRSEDLTASGFETQVAVGDDYFPLFWHADDGQRLALRAGKKGIYRSKGSNEGFTRDELASFAAQKPERFSPGVMLRPVVQDYLFPTICYFGGGAEIAYFAQNSEVYRVLDRPATPILHRQSFTVVEAKHERTMETYELKVRDLFNGFDELLPQIVDGFLDRGTARTFAEVEESIDTQLDRLDRELSEIDRTLAANLATRRRKIIYHIAALRKKCRVAELKKDETIHRRIESMFISLLPNNGLQERTINVVYFLNQNGPRFIDWMYRAIDLDDKSHRVIYL